jgi:predicted nucleic acid-binding protein
VVITSVALDGLCSTGLLTALPGLGKLDVVIPEQALDEVAPGNQQAVREAGQICLIRWAPLDGFGAIALYASLRAIMSPGEAASIAMAHTWHWLLASDDSGCFQVEANKLLGANRLLSTAGLLQTPWEAQA